MRLLRLAFMGGRAASHGHWWTIPLVFVGLCVFLVFLYFLSRLRFDRRR